MNDCEEIGMKDANKYSEMDEIGYRSKAQQEFINLIYKDILMNFITECDDFLPDENICVNKSASSKNKSPQKQKNNLPAKKENHFQDGEKYEILFEIGNSYSGQMNNDTMEGVGSYNWHCEAQYKGELKKNRIKGKGLLIWKANSSWYEGEFLHSIRHGKGTMINQDFSLFYTGSWHMGRKNGNGLCRYGEENYYDGEWVMGKREGMGYRVYPNGSVYSGNWENDLRHGSGTMVWPNGDIYRGEWKFGHMQGYGEYVWGGYFNNTLSWPQENCYMGHWNQSVRHGKGLLKLNSAGGAKFFGTWNMDKKHGQGLFIGNDGSTLERNPLFQNDILIPDEENNVRAENSECPEKNLFIEKSSKISRAIKINHLNPEQWPILSKFMRHLSIPNQKNVSIIRPKKCDECKIDNKNSCNCLEDSIKTKEINQSSSVENAVDDNIEHRKLLLEQEEISLRHSLTTHMLRLRKIYKIYAKVYCANEKVSPHLSMSRMSLWQLWRDCNIHRKNISLIEIDTFIATSNPKILMEKKHHPFESIEIWQFLYALLELSWKLYSKHENSGVISRLADGFCKLLELDIFPNAGNHSGKIFDFGVDFCPLAIYQLYRQVGEPHSVKKLLKATHSAESPVQNCESSIPTSIFIGKNAKIIGERISFIPKSEPLINWHGPNSPEEFTNKRDLSTFRELGATKFLSIVSTVCPSIKDEELNSIINIDYELTFLEFYEILLEASVALLKKKKIREQKRLQMIEKSKKTSTDAETVSVASLNTRVQSSQRKERKSTIRKKSRSHK